MKRLEEADLLPFPYRDCRSLLASRIGRQKRYRDLVPDLDIYFSWVSGSCSWGGKILTWSPERIRRSLKLSRASFFDWFPVYNPLKLQVVKWRYPELYRDFEKHDKMKRLLSEILTYLSFQPDYSQIEVAVTEKTAYDPFRPPLPSRRVRLAHRQIRTARRRWKRREPPMKFKGPALRVIRIKPLGESIF